MNGLFVMLRTTETQYAPGANNWEARPSFEELVARDINAKVAQHLLCVARQTAVRQPHISNGRETSVEEIADPWGHEERLERFIHYPNTEELQRSASEGCHFCTLLWGVADYNMKAGAYTYDTEDGEESEGESEPAFGSHVLSEANLRPSRKRAEEEAKSPHTRKESSTCGHGVTA